MKLRKFVLATSMLATSMVGAALVEINDLPSEENAFWNTTARSATRVDVSGSSGKVDHVAFTTALSDSGTLDFTQRGLLLIVW